jgi:hypothetical protein
MLVSSRAVEFTQYDSDALTLGAGTVLNGAMDPDYFALSSTEVYRHGRELAERHFAYLSNEKDERLEQLAEGFSERDLLEAFIAAWGRQLQDIQCPIRIENGKVLHHLKGSSITPLYGEDVGEGWREYLGESSQQSIDRDKGIHR